MPLKFIGERLAHNQNVARSIRASGTTCSIGSSHAIMAYDAASLLLYVSQEGSEARVGERGRHAEIALL